jgi:LemA protein
MATPIEPEVGALPVLLAAIPLVLLMASWAAGATRRLTLLRAAVLARFAEFHAQLLQRLLLIEALAAGSAAALREESAAVDPLHRARMAAANAAAAAATAPGAPLPMTSLADAESRLIEALPPLIALAETDPGLQHDPLIQAQVEALREGRARLAFARQAFDNAVDDYNAAIRRIPAQLVAKLLRLAPLTGLTPARMRPPDAT